MDNELNKKLKKYKNCLNHEDFYIIVKKAGSSAPVNFYYLDKDGDVSKSPSRFNSAEQAFYIRSRQNTPKEWKVVKFKAELKKMEREYKETPPDKENPKPRKTSGGGNLVVI